MPKTKAALIEAVALKMKLPIGRADLIVNHVFDAMCEALHRNEGIEIRGFGTFTIREYGSYHGRNPRTGEFVHVKAKRLPFFKVGKELRERVNGNSHVGRGVSGAGGLGGDRAEGGASISRTGGEAAAGVSDLLR